MAGLSLTRRLWTLCLAAMAVMALAAPAGAQFLGAPERARETPAAFAQRLVKLYAPKGEWWREKSPAADAAYRARVYAQFYDPQFDALMNDNTALAMKHGGGVDLDYDPVCQCQDDAGPLQVTSVRQRSADTAEMNMKPWCDKGAVCRGYLIVIRRIGGAWRISDVVGEGGSVRAMLIRHNACLRITRTDAEAARCLS